MADPGVRQAYLGVQRVTRPVDDPRPGDDSGDRGPRPGGPGAARSTMSRPAYGPYRALFDVTSPFPPPVSPP